MDYEFINKSFKSVFDFKNLSFIFRIKLILFLLIFSYCLSVTHYQTKLYSDLVEMYYQFGRQFYRYSGQKY